MDALLPAFILAALAGWDGTGQRLAAHLVRAGGNRWAVLGGCALATLLIAVLSAIGGVLIEPYLTANAAQLILAVALAYAGLAAFGGGEKPDVKPARAGTFLTALTALIATELPGAAAFFAFALAAGSPHPVLVALGVAAGGVAALSPGALGTIPPQLLRPVRWAIGAMFLVAGAITALRALRLL